jgi:hypothetical protein
LNSRSRGQNIQIIHAFSYFSQLANVTSARLEPTRLRVIGSLAIPQNKQNRIKRCGAVARRLEYIPHHDLPAADGEFPMREQSYWRTAMRPNF